MPDGDIFSRNVERGWQTASHHVFSCDDEKQVVSKLSAALSRILKAGGCPGIGAIAAIVATALEAADPRAVREESYAALRRIGSESGSAVTEIAIIAARRMIENPADAVPLPEDRLDKERVRSLVAERALVEIAEAKACSGGLLLAVMRREGASRETLVGRKDRSLANLAASPELARLAQQLLLDPHGERITTPRSKIPKPSLEETVNMALVD